MVGLVGRAVTFLVARDSLHEEVHNGLTSLHWDGAAGDFMV